VAGANKGIGYAIVEKLSEEKGLHVLLGSRDAARGQAAVKQLGRPNVSLLALDVDDALSVEKAADDVKTRFGGLDILVNNAGIAWKGDAFDETVARGTLGTNYFGTLRVCQRFLPLLRAGGRVVNVSSTVGVSALRRMSAARRQQFLASDLTIDALSAIMTSFIDDVKADRWQAQGWPKTAYGVSKVGMSMLTRILARDNKTSGVLINACCPGYVRTDMAGPSASKSPAEGAETPVFLALAPAGTANGVFWSDKRQSDWV